MCNLARRTAATSLLISVAIGRKTAIVRHIENGSVEPYFPKGAPERNVVALRS